MEIIKRQQTHFMRNERVVLVTGVSSGIGLAQAQIFLQKGHSVIGLDLQIPPQTLLENCKFKFYEVDLSQSSQIYKVFESIGQAFPILDILCNTVGQLDQYVTIESMDENQWTQLFSVNLTSHFLITKLALPLLLKAPASRIINMTSIAGLVAGGGGIAYTTFKHGLVGFTKQLAYDYAHTGLRVNGIAPGAIDTPMNIKDFEENDGKMAQWVADQVPVKRWAQAEEVANLTFFLASDGADYIHGSILPLDGGWLVR